MIIVLASGALGYAIGRLTSPSGSGTPTPDGGTPVVYKTKPVVIMEQVSIATTVYTQVCKWTLTQYQGLLEEISLDCDNLSDMQFNLSVGSTLTLKDKKIQSILNLKFEEQLLESNTEVILSAKSISGGAILVNGLISGKELQK